MLENDDKQTIADGTQIERTIIPQLSGDVVEMVLEINELLVKVCLEYQNKGWIDDPDYKIYQARLQQNLLYLCSAMDSYLTDVYIHLPEALNYSPQIIPRSATALDFNTILTHSQTKFDALRETTMSHMEMHLAGLNDIPLQEKNFTRVFDVPASVVGNPSGQYRPLMPFEYKDIGGDQSDR